MKTKTKINITIAFLMTLIILIEPNFFIHFFLFAGIYVILIILELLKMLVKQLKDETIM